MPLTASAARHSWRLNLFVLWSSQLITMLAFSAVMPFLPLYVQYLGVESTAEAAVWAGVLSAGGQLMMAVMAPVWGAVADRYGPKLMVQRAQFAGGAIVGLMGLVANVQQLLVLRVTQGVFSGTVTAARVLAASIVPAQQLGMTLGLMQMATFVGSTGGPLIGGFVADNFGFRSAFLVTALGTIASGITVFFFVHDPTTARTRKATKRSGFRENLMLLQAAPHMRTLIAVIFCIQVGSMSISPILPLFIGSISPEERAVASTAGLVLGATAATSALAAVGIGRLGDRLGHQKILLICTLGAGLVYLPQAFVTHPWQLLALRAILGVFMGGVFPSAMALVGLSAPPESRGLVYGLTGSAQALGGAVGPLFGAFTAAAFGMRTVFVCTAVILIGVGGMVARDVRYNSARALSGRGSGGVPHDSPSPMQDGDSGSLPH